MRVHIYTLTWQGADKLNNLQEGLYNNLNNFDFIWHIRNNGSDKKTKDVVNGWSKKNIKYYEIGHNRDSFAQGMNYLAQKSKPDKNDLILLLNNDVQFIDDQSFSNMYNLMKKTDAGVIGARLLYSRTTNLQHAGVIFGEKYGRMPYHFRHREESDDNAKLNRYFQAVTAACCLVKNEDFEKIGYFSEHFRWAFEDVAMCVDIGSLRKNNIAYCGQTQIYHEESASLKKNPVNKMFLQHNVSYFKTNYSSKYHLDHHLYLQDPNYNVIND